MAVSQGAILGLALAGLIALLTPFATYFICRPRMELPLRNIAIGAGIFVLFALMLESAMHFYILRLNPVTAAWLKTHAWGYVIYGAGAAAIFEETGRLIAFRFLVGRTGDAGTAVSYGIGHGGAESIIVGALAQAQMAIFAALLNAGKLQAILGAKLPAAAYAKITDSLLHLDFLLAASGGSERICAFLIQIALSLLVWRAVERNNWRWFAAALFMHAGVDSLAALFQRGMLSLVAVESMVFAIGAALLIFFIARLPARRPSPSA